MPFIIDEFIEDRSLPKSFHRTVEKVYIPISNKIIRWVSESDKPLVIAINGAQGTGKSTLSEFLSEYLKEVSDLNLIVLSLDDLYKTKSDRLRLSEKLHPLFKTRGVPGTHDVDLGIKIVSDCTIKKANSVKMPVFRKDLDDRVSADDWHSINGPVDVVLFEGWCVAAKAQPLSELSNAINKFELLEDPKGLWRRSVNDFLENEYRELFDNITHIIMLRVPSFNCIYQWRAEQEEKLANKFKGANHSNDQHFMDKDALEYFISHFERLTKWMLEEMPSRSNIVVDFNPDHSICSVNFNDE